MMSLGKLLIVAGVVLIVVGMIVLFSDRIPWLGRLPGDIHVKRDGYSFYFPVVTMLIVSVLLTVILNLFGRGK